ncbi:MAG TPA: hypothetical protein VHN80_24450 [Kineosporiaceae bacterium]|nr:hypothetical protein [Kineosporiaceae bacterium]
MKSCVARHEIADLLRVEADLAVDRLACPDCPGRLHGWGQAAPGRCGNGAGRRCGCGPDEFAAPGAHAGAAAGHLLAPAGCGRPRRDGGGEAVTVGPQQVDRLKAALVVQVRGAGPLADRR